MRIDHHQHRPDRRGNQWGRVNSIALRVIKNRIGYLISKGHQVLDKKGSRMIKRENRWATNRWESRGSSRQVQEESWAQRTKTWGSLIAGSESTEQLALVGLKVEDIVLELQSGNTEQDRFRINIFRFTITNCFDLISSWIGKFLWVRQPKGNLLRCAILHSWQRFNAFQDSMLFKSENFWDRFKFFLIWDSLRRSFKWLHPSE